MQQGVLNLEGLDDLQIAANTKFGQTPELAKKARELAAQAYDETKNLSEAAAALHDELKNTKYRLQTLQRIHARRVEKGMNAKESTLDEIRELEARITELQQRFDAQVASDRVNAEQ